MENKVNALIQKLIDGTKNEVYNWDCLDECIKENCASVNIPLRKYVISNNKSYYNKPYSRKILFGKYGYNAHNYIHYSHSFSLPISGGVVTLLTFSDDVNNHYYKLLLQNTIKNDAFAINTRHEYQEELYKLLKLIKDKRDNVNNLIDRIIGEN